MTRLFHSTVVLRYSHSFCGTFIFILSLNIAVSSRYSIAASHDFKLFKLTDWFNITSDAIYIHFPSFASALASYCWLISLKEIHTNTTGLTFK